MNRSRFWEFVSAITLLILLMVRSPVYSQSQQLFYFPYLSNSWTGYLPIVAKNPPPTPTSTPLPTGTPPPFSTSYYLLTVNSTALYNLGCQLGALENSIPGSRDMIVVLDFGSPKVVNGEYGTDLFWMVDASITQIKGAVENFGRGFYVCSANDTGSQMYVAIGTTNYGTTIGASTAVARAHGAAWAKMVNDVNAWFVTYGYSSQVHAVGANDLEPAWNTAAISRAWVDGYDSVNLYDYYDFGTADGCATRADPNRVTCANGWTREDVWYKAYGTRPGFPLPEIYNTRGANAEQWALISLYSVNTRGYKIEFHGVLTQWQACQQVGGTQCTGVDNTPATGWLQLYNELKKDIRTYDTPRWSTDMLWAFNLAADTSAIAKTILPAVSAPDLTQQTIASTQKALTSPGLDLQMKSSLQEKLTDALRIQADQAVGKANPASKDPSIAPAAPQACDTGFQVGIFDGAGGLIHPWEGTMINHWQSTVNGEYVLVSAGAQSDDATQGLVMVMRVSADRQHFSRQFYATPQKDGAVHIVSADGTDLLLAAENGATLQFDMISNQFK